MSLSQRRNDHDSSYESFSDLMLGVTVLLIALVAVLAINVSVRSDTAIKNLIYQNRFTGGVKRPELFISSYRYSYTGAETPEAAEGQAVYGDAELLIFMIESPSLAVSSTVIDDEGKTVTEDIGATFAGKTALETVAFFEMAAGIDPGSFTGEDGNIMLMNILYGNKGVMLGRIGSRVDHDTELTMRALKMCWPDYSLESRKIQSYSLYRKSSLYLYIESEETPDGKKIWIGDKAFRIPEQVESGELDFLVGLSSPNTQIVYLGEYSEEPGDGNKRIRFMKDNGFEDAARDYGNYHFTEWSGTHERILAGIEAEGPSEALRKMARDAYHNMMLSQAVINETDPGENLPPLLRYPEAWKAYTQHYAGSETEVPGWITREFLNPLGFNKRIPREEETHE